MKLSYIFGATTAYRIRSDFNVDGTGSSQILGTCNDCLTQSVWKLLGIVSPVKDQHRYDSGCYYVPSQADCYPGSDIMTQFGFCPATVSNFAGSDVSNQIPNNGRPTQFCDNFYNDWFGPVTEIRLYCNNNSGEVRGIQVGLSIND